MDIQQVILNNIVMQKASVAQCTNLKQHGVRLMPSIPIALSVPLRALAWRSQMNLFLMLLRLMCWLLPGTLQGPC